MQPTDCNSFSSFHVLLMVNLHAHDWQIRFLQSRRTQAVPTGSSSLKLEFSDSASVKCFAHLIMEEVCRLGQLGRIIEEWMHGKKYANEEKAAAREREHKRTSFPRPSGLQCW